MQVSITDNDITGCTKEVDVIIAATASLAPIFDRQDYEAAISEGALPGVDVIQVSL